MAAVSLSSEAEYKRGFGPMFPGIKLIPYGDIEALKAAINRKYSWHFYLNQFKVKQVLLFHQKVS